MFIAKTLEEFERKLTDDSYSNEFREGCYKEWKVGELWKLSNNLPTRIVPLVYFKEKIQKWINFESYTDDAGRVLVEFDTNHFNRIREADLMFPIILSRDENVMDGMHRLMKAYLCNLHVIKVVKFENDPEPNMIYIKE